MVCAQQARWPRKTRAHSATTLSLKTSPLHTVSQCPRISRRVRKYSTPSSPRIDRLSFTVATATSTRYAVKVARVWLFLVLFYFYFLIM